MDKQTLEANVIAESHRADKASEIGGFLRRAEDRIARSVRAVEMHRSQTITEIARIEAEKPSYRLANNFLEDRVVFNILPSEGFAFQKSPPLDKVALSDLGTINHMGSVKWYALRSDEVGPIIQFAGNPGLDAEFIVEYFGKLPRLTNPTDTNLLLENHEALYLHATLFELFRNIQDLELAQIQLDSFDDAVNTVNELAGRFFGGTRVFGRKRVIGDTAGSGY